ncbi:MULTISPECIES: mercury(II) reductase [Streptomyces]|uniref:Mercuric reductase n=1 Tax=Streptomyces plicatus TaxID=1922 RepID=A0ABW1Y5D6_STRPL|nr:MULTISPECIES: mercury(II) reductase [Streptomyces]MBJ6622368.1 mercury(II) reductase [Streptomyces sp. DHE17-7]RSS66420.1 mercury(II) reductase [Streptomyces sp. WAC06273]GGZ72372.1 mercuric reductase MerA [Streptomyces plicatus]GHC28546.1 mercuric reductase MerA [Streptomyces vinaceusdrappus]
MNAADNGFDLAVIGSGGGAFAAAIAARRKGRSVVMVERSTTGGTCVNTGCVPSKALLAAAEARRSAVEGTRFAGIRTEAGPVAFDALIDGKDKLVQQMRAEKYTDLAAEYGWDILEGTARFTGDRDNPALEVASADGGGSRRIEAAHYLVATGSAPWAPPVDGLEGAGYLTSTTAMDLDTLPESLLVLGAGYVGLEQTQLFARLGSKVTVIARSRLTSGEEPEISAALQDVFADEGITVHTHTRLTGVRRDAGGIVAIARTGDGRKLELRATHLLVATGRRPVTDGLDLDAVGVETGERGEVVVDEQLRTANPRIWAAGDVTGHPQFVYVASAHGALIADNAFDGAGRTVDYHHLPRVTFTTPAIASAGLTDAEAAAQGYTCDCRVLPLEYVPRALVNRDTRGLIKLVADASTGRLLGAHVLADGAGDVIATAVYALANDMTVQQMADLWCPYLTMAEGLKLAAQTYTRDVSKLSCCAS